MTCRKHEYSIEEGTFFNTLFVPRELGLAMLGLELACSDHACVHLSWPPIVTGVLRPLLTFPSKVGHNVATEIILSGG